MTVDKLRTAKNYFCSYMFVLPVSFFAILLFCFFTCDLSAAEQIDKNYISGVVIATAFALCSVVGMIAYLRGLLNAKTVIILVFICGFAMRLAYALKYNYYVYQHDVESLRSSGHLSYIYGLAMGEGLPESNDWQFSHPPLHHFIASLVVKASIGLGKSADCAFENVQLLTVFFSSLTMFAGYRILKLLKISGNALVLGSMLLAFHPVFYIFAGSINNDCLTLLLSMYAIVFLIKWYKNPGILNAVLCGAFIGLGMMTKVSAALIAVVAAITVVFKFITDKKLKFGSVFVHAVCFVLVLLPLGLWHPIRNFILFEQPLGYVAPISIESELYIGDISVLKRLLLPFSTIHFGVFTDVWSEYNVWYYLLRNSLFGEYSFGNIGVAAYFVVFNLLLILLTIVSLVYVVKNKNRFTNNLPLTVLFVVQLAFFVYFNIRYPFGCTMDFRYIAPVLFSGIAFLSFSVQKWEKGTSLVFKTFGVLSKFCVCAFCILSIIVFI